MGSCPTCCGMRAPRAPFAAAPVRQIQELLGHASLETAGVYTRVEIKDITEAMARAQPR